MSSSKKLSLFVGITLVVGNVIGSGVFMKPGKVLAASGTTQMALFAWALGGFITITSGLSVAEVASRIPKVGGSYIYIENLYGHVWGFLSGWVQTLVYGPAFLGALSLYFSSLFCAFFGLTQTLPIAFATMALLSIAAALSTSLSAKIQNISTTLKLVPIAGITLGGIFWGKENALQQVATSESGSALSLSAAVLATMWAYEGWIQVTNLGDEIKEPSKNLPKAIIFGLSGVIALYLLVNIGLFQTMPVDEIVTLSQGASAKASEILFGGIGGRLLSLGVLISIFGCLNGNLLTMSRLPYAMAKQGCFPGKKWIGELNPRTHTPVYAILFQFLCAVFFVSVFKVDQITDISVISVYGFYGAIVFGVFLIRAGKYSWAPKGQSSLGYKTPLYPLVPILSVLSIAYLILDSIRANPLYGVISVGVLLAGLPVGYFLGVFKKK